MNYKCPLDEMRYLLTRQRILQDKYGITNSDIYDLEYYISLNERDFKMSKTSMNGDIGKFDIFMLTRTGTLKKILWIKSTNDYNHYFFHLHHFIPKHDYNKNKKWYDERGIKQFLILLPIPIHEQLHGIGIKTITDEAFKAHYKISKWALLFNRKYSQY